MTGFFGLGNLLMKKRRDHSVSPKPKGRAADVLLKSLGVLEAAQTDEDKHLSALQKLYQISEKESQGRITLAQQAEARLVPLLLRLLREVYQPHSEVSRAALVLLNNLSTEPQNQRFIAVDCGAVGIFSQLLCEDPSCTVLAICFANLSLTAAVTRVEWVALNKRLEWMQALAYCIELGVMTHDEYLPLQPFLEGEVGPNKRRTPAEYLTILRANKPRTRIHGVHETLPAKEDQLFPETVRWCLHILQNLTRPHPRVEIASFIFDTGVMPLVLRHITLCRVKSQSKKLSEENLAEGDPSPNSVNALPFNSPDHWDASSSSDAALFVTLNLAADAKNHQRLIDLDAVLLLSLITQFVDGEHEMHTSDTFSAMDFQSIKAKLALAFILSEGADFEEKDVVLLSHADILQLLELLVNALHFRAKTGPGGYLAGSMSTKMVIRGLRCLLSENQNRASIIEMTGTRFNSLLLKTVAMHVFASRVEKDAAEDAILSLYLLSSHCFNVPFLPTFFGSGSAARVLCAFARTKSTNLVVKHASQQLVIRLSHLPFGGSESDAWLETFELSDFLLSADLLASTREICLPSVQKGPVLRADLFTRPLWRKHTQGRAQAEQFAHTLLAVQDIIFANVHEQPDDFAIATTVAQACDDGNAAYGFLWVWADNPAKCRQILEEGETGFGCSATNFGSRFQCG